MFWRIRWAWRVFWSRCPTCGVPLSRRWQDEEGKLRFIEYCPQRHYVAFDNETEFEDEDADIEMTKYGL